MRRGRLALLAFIVVAFVMIASPILVTWWAERDACPRVSVQQAWLPGGVFYDISRAECGAEIGTVWQVRVAPSDGLPRIAFDARNAPVPIHVEQLGSLLTIELAEPPQGSTAKWVSVLLDSRSRPEKVLYFVNGAPRS